MLSPKNCPKAESSDYLPLSPF